MGLSLEYIEGQTPIEEEEKEGLQINCRHIDLKCI